jgi:hypothetical protein
VKRTLMSLGLALIMIATLPPRIAVAQESPLVPIKLQIVVSRSKGEKKVSSLPYTLWVTANDKDATRLRMGVEVPVVSTVFGGKDGTTVPQSSYSYRPVGTNIDVTASTAAGGGFSVGITLNESGVQFESKDTPRPAGAMAGVPAFSNFSSSFRILLKDGQTAQYTSASDPVSGETLKVDVTLNVLK